MSEIKNTTFNDIEVEIVNVPLNKCDAIWPFIMSWQLQISLGNWQFLQDCTADQIKFFQKFVCENVYKYKEKEDADGIITKVRENLSYFDLNEGKKDFVYLFLEVLEHNFGFFSGARRLLKVLLSRTSEATSL